RRPFFAFEKELWTLLLAAGRALTVLFLARQVARARAVQYRFEGRAFSMSDKHRTTELGTRFGKVQFTRPVARQVSDHRARVDLPVERELGLCGGFSLGTVVGIVRLAAMMAFAQARHTFRELHEWAPSPRAALRRVDAVGAEARPFLEQAPAPDDDGEVLVVQVDGRGAPMLTPLPSGGYVAGSGLTPPPARSDPSRAARTRGALPRLRSMWLLPKSCSAASKLWGGHRSSRLSTLSGPPSVCASRWCSSKLQVSGQRRPRWSV